MRAATRSTGNRDDAIEHLHGLIPREVVPGHQEVTAVEAGQQFRMINEALFGVSLLRGSHGHLLVSVLSTLAEFEGSFFAHDNPLSFTG